MNKYTILLDTNLLGKFKNGKLDVTNYDHFSVSKTFSNLIKFLEDNSIDNASIAIPKIVFEELIRKQIECYVEDLKTFDKFKGLPRFTLNVPPKFKSGYETHLRYKVLPNFIKNHKIIKLNYPENAILPNLIERVLEKRNPFYKNKKEGEKDTGFKDTIIWESLIQYALEQKNEKQNYILVSNDTDFGCEELKKEFEKRTECELEIKKSLSEIKLLFNEIKQLNLGFEFFKNIYNETFRKSVEHLLENNYYKINTRDGTYNIRRIGIGDYIYDINREESGIYELTIPIAVEHETFYTDYVALNILKDPPFPSRDSTDGLVKLEVEKSDNKVFLLNVTFEDISLIGNSNIQKTLLNYE